MASDLNQYWQRYELGGLVAKRNPGDSKQVTITGIYFNFDQRNDCREANPQAGISTNISYIELRVKGWIEYSIVLSRKNVQVYTMVLW
jgi:hypothetical protein